MKELQNICYIILASYIALNTAKSRSNAIISLPKYTYNYKQQYVKACAEYDRYYAENYCEILANM